MRVASASLSHSLISPAMSAVVTLGPSGPMYVPPPRGSDLVHVREMVFGTLRIPGPWHSPGGLGLCRSGRVSLLIDLTIACSRVAPVPLVARTTTRRTAPFQCGDKRDGP